MCIITDHNDIVVSVSLIPGVEEIPFGFNVYAYHTGDIPRLGDKFTKDNYKAF